MRGTGIGTCGLSKVHELHSNQTCIVASSQQWGMTIRVDTPHNWQVSVSKIVIDGGHFSLSSTSSAGIGTRSAMMGLHFDVPPSSVAAIHIKGGSFHVLGDEGGTRRIQII
jgi:hypothetical protein